jgi:hypothetical protein
LWAGLVGTVNAQEFRKPDEIKEIIIKSTYPVRLAFEMTHDDKLYVWVGFHPVYKTTPEEGYHYTGFLTDKLKVYEDGKLVSEISELKGMPEPKSVKPARIGFDLELYPRQSEDRANTIVLSSAAGQVLPGLGYTKNEFTLGPFPYQVNLLWAKVEADKGLLYVKANCGNTYDKVEKSGEVDPFSVLYTLDRELKLVDSFVFDKGTKRDKYEIYPSGGNVYLTRTGNLYLVASDQPAKTIKIKVKKWKLKAIR